MAIAIIKNAPIHAVAVVTNSAAGSETITLSNLAITGRQTAGTPLVNIRALHFSVPSGQTATITRNGVLLWTLTNSSVIKFDGFSDSRENGSNIVITTTGAASVVIELAKVSGFGDTQHINAI